MKPVVTLGGYMEQHDRAAAFGGADGRAYSCALYVDDEPDEAGRFAGSLLFVRWDEAGAAPAGHVESPVLAYGRTPEETRERLGAISLFDAKAALDEAIGRRPEGW
ncbi:MAG: hypothetical protein AB7L66_17205 [Gemmatimonadales bacterium]